MRRHRAGNGELCAQFWSNHATPHWLVYPIFCFPGSCRGSFTGFCHILLSTFVHLLSFFIECLLPPPPPLLLLLVPHQCCRCCCFIFCVGLLRYYHCLSCYSFLLHVGGVLSLLLLEVLLSSLNKYPLDLFVFSLRFRFLPCLKWHRLGCCYLPLVLCIQMTFFASSLFD